MYLNKRQVQALEIATDALQGCLEHDVEPEKSEFAIDVLSEMKRKDRKCKQKKKNKGINR